MFATFCATPISTGDHGANAGVVQAKAILPIERLSSVPLTDESKRELSTLDILRLVLPISTDYLSRCRSLTRDIISTSQPPPCDTVNRSLNRPANYQPIASPVIYLIAARANLGLMTAP